MFSWCEWGNRFVYIISYIYVFSIVNFYLSKMKEYKKIVKFLFFFLF